MKSFGNKIIVLIFCFLGISSFAQKIVVSNEISVRNNYAYDILPNIGDHIIFYHDRGIEHSFEVYDNNLRYKTARQPEFEKKNISTIGLTPIDSSFNFYYSFKDEGINYFRVIKFNKYVVQIDSATLLMRNRGMPDGNPSFTSSKDTSKVLIFTPEDKNLRLHLINNKTLKNIYEFSLSLRDINFKTDFEKIVLSNNGDIYIMMRRSSFWNRKNDDGFQIIKVNIDGTVTYHKFAPESDKISEILMDFDEKNHGLVLAGLVSENNDDNVNGYFGFSLPKDNIPGDAEIIINRFSKDFMADVSGKKAGKVKEISHFKLKDLIIRNDGGVIIISELTKEFSRRAQMNSTVQFGNYMPPQGFIDYYNEDLILLATFPDGREHWKKVLFKKQFSQDDGAIYSSYFIFKTPSRIRLLYNDEIKNDNTVSEYVLDPLGNFERKSVLSTEYQNLRLRFRNAIQIGPQSIIVPSEKSYKINLVKIDYGI